MKEIQSSGVIIHNKERMLICQHFGKKKDSIASYDFPKGKIDLNESPIDAAIREVEEETGIVLLKHQLKEVGYFDNYTDKKGIHLFSCYVKELPIIKKLKCTTYIDEEKKKPEMIGYKLVPLEETFWLYKVLQNVLIDINLKNLN